MAEHFEDQTSWPDAPAADPIPEPQADAIADGDDEELPAGFPLPDHEPPPRGKRRGGQFPPTEALRLIREILSDRSLGHAERIATAAVVLCMDNRDGTGWSSYRSVRDNFGLSLDSIAGALRQGGGKAIGRYLTIVGRGVQGSVRYAALRPAERSSQQSALRSSGTRAPVSRVKRSGGRRQSYPISNPTLLPHMIDAANGNDAGPKDKAKHRAPKPDPWRLATEAMSTDALRTDAFRAAWLEWDEYRSQARKSLAPATIKKQIGQLERFGHDAAIQSIQASITNGWQGLFAPKTGDENGCTTSAGEVAW
ncbi:MAG TPA: hypothetical protein PL151_19550 [Phycisphaerae bacterium]|nr:hypothetical protein [Phycisphaerae bacterium]